MRQRLLLVFFGFFIVSPFACAASMLGGAPAQQSFHEADPTQTYQSAGQHAIQVASADKAKIQQSASESHAKSVQPVAQSANASDGNQVAVNQAIQKNNYRQLEQQLTQLTQSDLQFQATQNSKVEMLSGQIIKLQQKQAELVQLMQLFNQQVVAFNRSGHMKSVSLAAVDGHEGANFIQQFQSQYSMYVIVLLLAAILLMLMFRRRTSATEKPQASIAEEEIDTKDEYDFMGSSEAIPAKLDLAHAYLAMEDFAAADKALQQVLASGTAEQKAEAKTMLASIPKS